MTALVPRFAPSRSITARAQFSPVFRRATAEAFTRVRLSDRSKRGERSLVPAPATLTPPTPAIVERWWDPHLVDRLQTPLSRIRE